MCPMTPFSYKMSPMDLQIVIMFMFGSDYCGKKHPALTYYLAVNLSIDPITSTWPSGSIIKAILGLAIEWLRHVGAASIIPPTLQKD